GLNNVRHDYDASELKRSTDRENRTIQAKTPVQTASLCCGLDFCYSRGTNVWNVIFRKLEQRPQSVDDHTQQCGVCADLRLQLFRSTPPVSEAALVLNKRIFQRSIKKRRLEPQDRAERLN